MGVGWFVVGVVAGVAEGGAEDLIIKTGQLGHSSRLWLVWVLVSSGESIGERRRIRRMFECVFVVEVVVVEIVAVVVVEIVAVVVEIVAVVVVVEIVVKVVVVNVIFDVATVVNIKSVIVVIQAVIVVVVSVVVVVVVCVVVGGDKVFVLRLCENVSLL